MRSTLIDAGLLIALFDKSDKYHLKALQFIKEFEGQLWSTWPVITEACHLLDFNTQVQLNFLIWIERGAIKLIDLNDNHLARIIELTRKFDDVPMDLADASLIVASEKIGCLEIASINSDFYIYRDIRNNYLTNIFM